MEGDQRSVRYDGVDLWDLLDAEADARTPSPAQRAASRRQGRALLRAARVAWPEDPGLAGLAASGAATARATGRAGAAAAGGGAGSAAARGGAAYGAALQARYRGGPHHAVVLGAAAAAAGCEPLDAARIAAYQAVAGPASAAVRLLGLDPFAVQATLARLAPGIDECAAAAAAAAAGPASLLPADAAPALDLLADYHLTAEVRLFAS
jgi:urease accessory protein